MSLNRDIFDKLIKEAKKNTRASRKSLEDLVLEKKRKRDQSRGRSSQDMTASGIRELMARMDQLNGDIKRVPVDLDKLELYDEVKFNNSHEDHIERHQSSRKKQDHEDEEVKLSKRALPDGWKNLGDK